MQAISRKRVAPCWQSAEELTLHVDATEIEAEKQEAQGTYHQVQGSMPLVGYVDGVCVGHEFREGNQSLGAGILAFAQSCEAALPAGKRVYFRSDSAAYEAEVINYYSQAGRSFSITADLEVAVKREIQNLPETAWQPYRTADGIATDRELAETVHSRKGTEPAFRLIVLRWPNPQPNLFEADRYGYQAVAANREEAASALIWKHNGRGNSENWHKELKSGLGMEVAAATRAGSSRPTRCISPSACWPITWPTPETAGAAGRLSHGDGGDAALEGVSAGGQAGAPRARLDAAD
jgi:hypothetical protein